VLPFLYPAITLVPIFEKSDIEKFVRSKCNKSTMQAIGYLFVGCNFIIA
jgi:hypothetical protein